MGQEVTEQKLKELCRRTLEISQESLTSYKQQRIDEKELEYTLLKTLLREVRNFLGMDANATIALAATTKDQNLILRMEMDKLLKKEGSYNVQQVIERELISKATKSQIAVVGGFLGFFTSILDKIKSIF